MSHVPSWNIHVGPHLAEGVHGGGDLLEALAHGGLDLGRHAIRVIYLLIINFEFRSRRTGGEGHLINSIARVLDESVAKLRQLVLVQRHNLLRLEPGVRVMGVKDREMARSGGAEAGHLLLHAADQVHAPPIPAALPTHPSEGAVCEVVDMDAHVVSSRGASSAIGNQS